MLVIDRIIEDSDVLRPMGDVEENFFDDISVDKLNTYFNDVINQPRYTNIIKRIAPIYDRIYPDDKEELIQLIKDFDLLGSTKIIEILVLLHHFDDASKGKSIYYSPIVAPDFIKTAIPAVKFVYDQIRFKRTLRDTLIANDLIDLFKFKFDDLVTDDTRFVVLFGSLKIFQYLWETIGEEHMMNKMFYYLRDNKLNILKYIFSVILKDNIEKTKYYLRGEGFRTYNIYNAMFRGACEDGDLELVKWLWEFGLKYDIDKPNLHIDDEDLFTLAVKSENKELVQWIWDKCIEEGDKVDLTKLYYPYSDDDSFEPMSLLNAILTNSISNNIDMIKYVYKLSLEGNINIDLYNLPWEIREIILNSNR